ncbi:MAG TPA: thiol:disulfide interchange protein DsbG, partial [Burkholderiaceae bacterium]
MIKRPSRLLCATVAWAGIAGLANAAQWPAPIEALQAHGVEVIGTFKAPGGVTGYAAIAQQQPLALYLTADGKQVIVGPMFDAKGINLSDEPLDRLVSKPMTERSWRALESSRWIADGRSSAARIVYVFTDPNCPYCNKFWNDARPWVQAGKVQLRHVMVGILGPTSAGKAAALLGAQDPAAALAQHEQGYATGGAAGGVTAMTPIPPALSAKLDANQALMERLGSQATPTIFFKDDSGKLQ